jgi:hypothetical protein
MDTNLDTVGLVAAASNRIGMVFSASTQNVLSDMFPRMLDSVPFELNPHQLANDMRSYPLPVQVALNAKNAPEMVGECIRDEEKMQMPIKCPFLVQFRVRLAMACRERRVDMKSDESAVYAFYLLAYAIRRQKPAF